MLKSYFFIPANRMDFLSKADQIEADYLIFDMEDSINDSIYFDSVQNLEKISKRVNYFIRTKFIENEGICIKKISDSINLGFFNFVIPKLDQVSQIIEIEKYLLENFRNDFEKYSFILLIESPKALIFLKEILQRTELNIIALALGSHDYCLNMGMKHRLNNLEFARQYMLNIAKAFNLDAIDIASMELNKLSQFETEAKSAFEMGYDAKFVLHPKQLQIIKNLEYYDDSEICEAEKVMEILNKIDQEDFTIIKVNNKLYEKPHMKRMSDIVEWSKTNGK